jgi:hypothetical protein
MKIRKAGDQSDSNQLKKPILNMTHFASSVIAEINKLRINPNEYAKKIVNTVSFLNDEDIEYKGFTIRLSEKKKAFVEIINFLEHQSKREKLSVKDGIVKCSEELMKVLILHDGIENAEEFTTNCHFEKRMNKYGCAFGELDELIDVGSLSPETIVLNFLLCDGDPKRRERKILFKENLCFAGVSTEILPCEKYCTVINLAEHYFDVGEDIPDSILRIYRPQVFKKLDQEKKERIKKMQEQVPEKMVKFIDGDMHVITHHLNHNTYNPKSHHNVTFQTISPEKLNTASDVNSSVRVEGGQHFNTISGSGNNNMRKSGVIQLTRPDNFQNEDEEEEDRQGINEYEEEEVHEQIENDDELEKEEVYNKYSNKNMREGQPSRKNFKENEIKNTNGCKDYSNLPSKGVVKKDSFIEDADEIYDDKILKVCILEKEVLDEKTKLKRVLCKKCITYKDGTTQSIVYAKNK